MKFCIGTDSRYTKLKSLFLVALGTLILALGTAAFLIPRELVSGGISGIAIVLYDLTGGAFFSVEMLITAFSWSAFFVGLIFLGKSFALKTLLSTALYPLFISLVTELGLANFLNGLLPEGSGALIASVLGGILVGAGLGLSFIGGGSTGGVDILALVICKKNPRLRTSRVILAVDAAIILFGAFVISDAKTTLLGIFSAVVAAFSIECVTKVTSKRFNIIWRAKKIDNFKN